MLLCLEKEVIMMSEKKKNVLYHPDSNLKHILIQFNEKMKSHLSKEMMYLSEKKDEYENQILQLKIEREQRDKKLFQHVEQKDIRKYFSPLNLSDMEDTKKDEKQKELSGQIKRIQEDILQIDIRMEEIRTLIDEMDNIIIMSEKGCKK